MTNYKILFLDIDGTVLLPNDTIEDSSKDAVKQVKETGIEVFLATGRPLHEVAHIAEALDVHSFIGYNGAYAVYKEKEILNEPMTPATIEQFLDIAKNHDHEMVLYTSDKNLFTAMDPPIVKDFIQKFHLQKNDMFSSDMINDILGITMMNLTEEDPALYEEKGNIHLSQVNVEGLRHSYDVIRDSVNKGLAVKTVLDLLELPQDSAIAFGDGMNDKEMLEFVAEGFAMGNAHPDLFQYAKNKTTAVTDSGIYNGLKSLGLVK